MTLEREGERLQAPIFPQDLLPEDFGHLKDRSSQTALFLIDNPILLPAFYLSTETRAITSEMESDPESTRLNNAYLSEVKRGIDKFDWSVKLDYPIRVDEARVLLTLLPLSTNKAKKPSRTEQITESLLAGFINKRFEGKTPKDYNHWRNSIASARVFLEAAVEPEPDLELLSKFYALFQPDYPQIISTSSIAFRAFFNAARAADPRDEIFLKMVSEIGVSIEHIADLIGRRDDWKKRSKPFDILGLQGSVIKYCLENNLSVEPGFGSSSYRDTLRNLAKNPDFRRESSISLDVKSVANLPVPADLIELVWSHIQFPTRAAALDKALTDDYNYAQNKLEPLTARQKALQDAQEFPIPLFIARYPLREKIHNLFDSSEKRRSQSRLLKYELNKLGEGWEAVPFSIKGIHGHAILKNLEGVPQSERVKIISQYIEKYDVESHWKDFKILFDQTNISSGDLHYSDAHFLLTREDYSAKSDLESLLDLRLPENLREKAIEILKQNFRMRRDLPQFFTRMPTQAGDLYHLEDHADLLQTIETAVLRKRVGGGLEFSMVLFTDPLVYPEGTKPEISGSINFQLNRANIGFSPDMPLIADDQRWILTNALLHLVERSCCPSIREVEEEIGNIERLGISTRSIPGYIGHVGGYRPSGERKRFTNFAATNFAEVVNDLYGDTRGLSLKEVNVLHRIEEPGDDRFLTYNKGREVEGAPLSPTRRSPPKNLIHIPA